MHNSGAQLPSVNRPENQSLDQSHKQPLISLSNFQGIRSLKKHASHIEIKSNLNDLGKHTKGLGERKAPSFIEPASNPSLQKNNPGNLVSPSNQALQRNHLHPQRNETSAEKHLKRSDAQHSEDEQQVRTLRKPQQATNMANIIVISKKKEDIELTSNPKLTPNNLAEKSAFLEFDQMTRRDSTSQLSPEKQEKKPRKVQAASGLLESNQESKLRVRKPESITLTKSIDKSSKEFLKNPVTTKAADRAVFDAVHREAMISGDSQRQLVGLRDPNRHNTMALGGSHSQQAAGPALNSRDGGEYSINKESNPYHRFMKKQKEQRQEENVELLQQMKQNIRIQWKPTAEETFPDIDSQLKIGFKMGEGAFATVYEGFDKVIRKNVAIKVFDKSKLLQSEKRIELIQKEIDVISKIPSHPNICEFYRVVEDRKKVRPAHQVYMVMEFCGSRTLSKYFKLAPEKRNEEQCRKIFSQLVTGVGFLHENHVFHRDLKLANILITSKDVLKIIDFGLSTTEEEPQLIACGTPSYFSPQMISRQQYAPRSVDIWCLGIILYKIFFGSHPFGGK